MLSLHSNLAIIYVYVQEFHRTLSEVVSRSLLYTMPTGKPLRRTLSNITAAEVLRIVLHLAYATRTHIYVTRSCDS